MEQEKNNLVESRQHMSRLPSVNYITFCKDNYTSENEFWKAVSQQTKLLIQNKYIVLFRHEDYDVYVLEYYYKDKDLGDYYPIPLLPEEEEIIKGYYKGAE